MDHGVALRGRSSLRLLALEAQAGGIRVQPLASRGEAVAQKLVSHLVNPLARDLEA